MADDSGALADKMDLKSILKLMKGMRESGVAVLEMPGLKLTSFPEQRPAQSAASIMAPPVKEDLQKFSAMQQARVEAAAAHQKKMQELRMKAGGGHSLATGKLVKDVYDTAMASAALASAKS